MIRLALLRHGRTAWNLEGRLQGRADIPVLEDALAELRRHRPPAPYAGWRWLASPLTRTAQTAAAIGVTATPEPALIETDWGGYEGKLLADLETDPAFIANEALGLDFQPPGGESPRMVQQRLAPLLARLAAAGTDCAAVSHKGVIRALLAWAFDWPMLGKPPVKLDWSALQVFHIDAEGRPSPGQFNIPLDRP